MKKWLIVLICLIVISHSAYPLVDFHLNPKADLTKYKRIAVLGFNDTTNAPGSGNVVADLIASELMKKGYEVVERSRIEMILSEQKLRLSGIIDTSTAIRLGEILEVDAIVTGALSQYNVYTTQQPRYEYVEQPRYTGNDPGERGRQFARDITGRKEYKKEYRGTETVYNSVVGVTVKMIDIETAATVWQGSNSDTKQTAVIQPLASSVIRWLLMKVPQAPSIRESK